MNVIQFEDLRGHRRGVHQVRALAIDRRPTRPPTRNRRTVSPSKLRVPMRRSEAYGRSGRTATCVKADTVAYASSASWRRHDWPTGIRVSTASSRRSGRSRSGTWSACSTRRTTDGFGRCVDLGCGSGELTLAVDRAARHPRDGRHRHRPTRCSPGPASSSARPTIGCASPAATSPSGPAAATTTSCSPTPACSGCPTTPRCSPGGGRRSRPRGQLAVQVPSNADHPAHVVATQVAATEPFVSAMNGMPPADPVAANVLDPAQYVDGARRARRRRPSTCGCRCTRTTCRRRRASSSG